MQMEIAQSTPTARSIAALVQARYGLGDVIESEFLRRSFNQVYRLGFASGQRVVARICAERPRGGPNVAFEAAALEHWAHIGCQVSRCVTTATGEVAIQLPLPEGDRTLMLFEYLDGEFTLNQQLISRLFRTDWQPCTRQERAIRGPQASIDLTWITCS